MRRALLAATVVAACLAPRADAKMVTHVELCGPDGCTAIALPEGLHEWPGGGPNNVPPRVSPFVEVRVTIDGRATETLWYVPTARLFASERAGSVWWGSTTAQQIDRIIVRAARDIEPYRPRAIAARVDDLPVVGDVSSYVDLFRRGTPAAAGGGRFVEVAVETTPPSPWSRTRLLFYPGDGLLQRGGEVVRLPTGIAADLRAARPIGHEASRELDWPLVSGSLTAALLLALAATLLSRRRPRTA